MPTKKRPVKKQKAHAERFSVAAVERALRLSGGNHAAAARRLGCSRSAVGGYIARHARLAEVAQEIKDELLDAAEAALHARIKAGDLSACIFFLRTRGVGRGYGPQRMEVTGPGGGPIAASGAFALEDMSKLDDAELRWISTGGREGRPPGAPPPALPAPPSNSDEDGGGSPS